MNTPIKGQPTELATGFGFNTGTGAGVGIISSNQNSASFGSGGGTSNTANLNHYSAPVLIDTIVTDETIELVYKRENLIWAGMPANGRNIEVYKVVYSRFDGSAVIVQGRYIAPSDESYMFD